MRLGKSLQDEPDHASSAVLTHTAFVAAVSLSSKDQRLVSTKPCERLAFYYIVLIHQRTYVLDVFMDVHQV